jgi:pimeloyl-ACP methyl ester carboxylesterase
MPVAKINGINLNYVVEGAGQPLVLITGIGLALGSLNAQAVLFKRYFKVIRLDNRGSGKTDKPLGPYTTRLMAEDVLGLMDHLHIAKAIVLGYSMGGMIAQEFAISHPDRLEKLLLCSTYSCIDNESGPSPELGKLVGLSKLKYLLGFLRLITDSPIKPILWLFQKILNNSKASEEAFAAQSVACQNHNAFDKLLDIKAPTLVIVGTGDRLIRPQSSKVLASKIPGARLVEIRDGSHFVPIEKAKNFNSEVLHFLQS